MNKDSMESVLEVKGLAKSVVGPAGSLTILKQVDLTVCAGEAVAILGASGSGKSTLLGLLAGLDEPTDGEVCLFGRTFSSLDEDARATLRAGQVGFVFQSFQLLPRLTALENVMLAMELAGQIGDARARAEQTLSEVGLGERLGHYPRQLSGGEQQRVALARAFAVQPRILFADEPTGNLDERTGAQVIDLMFRMREAHDASLVLVTHDPSLAGRCERRLRLEEGVLKEVP
ncbi:MAG: ABC transporter ATP-binding protein [Gammaproteobacteria bacterium]|jgi:putative ABC transport system ATP-binding protein